MILLAGILLIGAASLATAQRAYASAPVSLSYFKCFEIAGDTACGTAAEAAEEGFALSSVSTVIVASNASYHDMLSASGLAGLYDCPVLLTPKGSLDSETARVISECAPGIDVIVVGGPAAVSDDVKQEIEGYPWVGEVERVWGSNAIGTSRAVYAYGASLGDLAWDMDNAVVATSASYYDAISIAPFAAYAGAPVLLADASGSVGTEELNVISGVRRAIIVGGESVVSAQTEADIKNVVGDGGGTVERLWGQTAYDTNLEVVRFCRDASRYDLDYTPVPEVPSGLRLTRYIASGNSFSDAMAVGVSSSAGKSEPAAVYLADLSGSGLRLLEDLPDSSDDLYVSAIYFAGGPAAVSYELRDRIISEMGHTAYVLY